MTRTYPISSPLSVLWNRLRTAAFCLILLLLQAPALFAAESPPADSLLHDPYDLSGAVVADSSDVYESPPGNPILQFPRTVFSALVYPFGRFTVYAEHVELVAKYRTFFTNEAGTFGLFPYVELGGQTGTGGGAQMFSTNLFGKRKILTGRYVYSGPRGQTGEGMYLDPDLFGSGLVFRLDGGFLNTQHDGAAVNTPVRDSPTRLFRIEQVDAAGSLAWRLRRGPMAPFRRQASVEVFGGYGRRDFRVFRGGSRPLTNRGATPQAALLKGLGEVYTLFRVGARVEYDDRDYKPPAESVRLPLNYHIPGRVLTYHEGLYHSFRDLGYPGNGGLIRAEVEVVNGTDAFRFYRTTVELQRFLTLFWKDRVLAVRARLEKVRGMGDGRVPHTELVPLGGGDSARGYRRGFFRGQGGLLFNVEYRWPIWHTWNAFAFWDESHVFDHYEDMTWEGFNTSVGGGISFRTELGLIGKLQVGHSAEENALVGLVFGVGF